MIDFISSKLGLLIAGLLMLGMIGGLINVIQEVGEQKAYDRVAKDLADILSSIEAVPGEVTMKLVFEQDESQNEGTHFPQFIGGEAYVIHLFPDVVTLHDSDGKPRAMAYIAGTVHGWDECIAGAGSGLSSADVQTCDEAAPWVFPSTAEPLFIDVIHETHVVDSQEVLLTFVREGTP